MGAAAPLVVGTAVVGPATAESTAPAATGAVVPPEGRRILVSCKLSMIANEIDGHSLSATERLSLAGEAGFDGVDFDEAGNFSPTEVRDAVMAFKRSGKSVVAYLEYGGDQQYYLATAADEIFLMPTSPLDLMGVASYELFLRGTFDLIGVYPDFLHAGDYKTAGNLFTEETFTQPHREMSESLNADLFDQLVLDIATSRSRPASEIRALIAEGPFLPEDALAAGLVDELAYEDEVLARDAEEQQPISGQDYAKVSLRSVGLNTGPKIAVIHVAGVINTGRSGYNSTQGSVVGSDTVIENLREARND